jgi:uncharacterized protein involved in exopolysaccharide biosynthesis
MWLQYYMNSVLNIAWHALLTAIVVSLISGLFLLGLPQVYQAKAKVVGTTEDLLLLDSAEVLEAALKSSRVEARFLERWQDSLFFQSSSALSLLKESIEVRRSKDTGLIEIAVNARDPGVAATLANAVVEAFLKKVKELSVTPETKALLSARVDEVESDKQEFLAVHPEARDFAGQRQELSAEQSRLNREQHALTRRMLSQEEKIQQADSGDMAAYRAEPGVQQASRQFDQLRLQHAQLKVRYGSQHQKMIELNSKVNAAQELLDREVEAAKQRIERQGLKLRDEQAALESAQSDLEIRTTALNKTESAWQRLEARHASAIRQYESGNLPERERRYASAAPPESVLGLSLLERLALVFAVTFAAAGFLLSLRPLIKRHDDQH